MGIANTGDTRAKSRLEALTRPPPCLSPIDEWLRLVPLASWPPVCGARNRFIPESQRLPHPRATGGPSGLYQAVVFLNLLNRLRLHAAGSACLEHRTRVMLGTSVDSTQVMSRVAALSSKLTPGLRPVPLT